MSTVVECLKAIHYFCFHSCLVSTSDRRQSLFKRWAVFIKPGVKSESLFRPHKDLSSQVRQQTDVMEVYQKQSCQSTLPLSVSELLPTSILPHLYFLGPSLPPVPLHTYICSHYHPSVAFVILHLFCFSLPFHSVSDHGFNSF